MPRRRNPKRFYLVAAAVLIAALSLVFWRMRWNPLLGYLVGVNAIVFLFYGFDKRRAVAEGRRIPELVLHVLALLGGTPGAFIGQILFRHKTQKLKFKLTFAIILLLQVIALILYWKLWGKGS